MLRLRFACFLGSFALLACNAPVGGAENIGETDEAIAHGSADTTHTAVVSVLSPGSGNSFSECTGTIVQVKGGVGYVLTAAHCCDGEEGGDAPTVVVAASDYTVGEQALFGGNASPPVYKVVAGSVYWDANYQQTADYDFCMLKFSGATGLPTIGLPSGADGLKANNSSVEYVGYGKTDTNDNNSKRNHGSATIAQLSSTVVTANESSNGVGTCQGDSGGPSLLPSGVAQTSQLVVATTSRGTSQNCGDSGEGEYARVSSEIGTGKFITSFLADAPIGNPAGTTSSGDCDSCTQTAENGACSSQTDACANDSKCTGLITCLNNGGDEATCESTAGTTAVNELVAFDNCICDTGCPTECATECGGSSSTTSSSTGGGSDCNTCANDSQTGGCASQFTACGNDNDCVTLFNCINGGTDAQTCANASTQTAIDEYNAINTCICSTACVSECSAECGTGTTSATSTGAVNPVTSGTQSTSGTGIQLSTTSTGTGSTTGSASGEGGEGGSGSGAKSTCNCSEVGGGENAPGALIGLALLGAVVARRRRTAV